MRPNEIVRQDTARAAAQQARHAGDERVHVSLHRLLRLQHAAAGFSFLPRQPVASLLSGRHASRLRGRGLNCEEVRAYHEYTSKPARGQVVMRPLSPYRRIIIPRVHTPAAGSQTHRNSLYMICTPLLEKNRCTLIGETSIGRHGKTYLALLKGANSATPRPPLVSISSKGCDRVDTNKKRKTTHGLMWLWRKSVNVSSTPSTAAKTMEWVKPRCPNIG